MNQVIATERIPIKAWLNDIEDGALEQARNIANLPFAFKHIALMPDTHLGYGVPIGGVLATTDNIVVLGAVGVDIGCGMCALKTSLTEININQLKNILGHIRKTVPVRFDHHKEPQDQKFMPECDISDYTVVKKEYKNALKQVGTLGSGKLIASRPRG